MDVLSVLVRSAVITSMDFFGTATKSAAGNRRFIAAVKFFVAVAAGISGAAGTQPLNLKSGLTGKVVNSILRDDFRQEMQLHAMMLN